MSVVGGSAPFRGVPVTCGGLAGDCHKVETCFASLARSFWVPGACTLESCPFHMLTFASLGQIQSLGDTPSFWGLRVCGSCTEPLPHRWRGKRPV